MPALVVIDGSRGLRAALAECWPKVAVQRCTVHKLRNLEAHAPKRLHEELRQDYREIVYAEDERAARRAWLRFTSKWKKLCPAVVESLEEAGAELLTFYRFPESQWKSLRTTNIVERDHRGVPPAGEDAGGAAVGGQRAAVAVRSGGLGAAAVPEARWLPGAGSGLRGGRVTMTPVSATSRSWLYGHSMKPISGRSRRKRRHEPFQPTFGAEPP